MVEFTHVITDIEGLHARPVTVICAEALKWGSAITVSCNGRSASAADLMGLMGLSARRGDELAFHVEGSDEQEAAAALRTVVSGL